MCISLGSRGLSGKTYSAAALGLTVAAVLGVDVNLLGGSEVQSRYSQRHMQRMWEYSGAPKYMLLDSTVTRMTLSNKAIIKPLTASQKVVRGDHPAFLFLDELDEMDWEIFQSAIGQPMTQKNWLDVDVGPLPITGTSTLQYPDQTMQKAIDYLEDKGHPLYKWCMFCTSNPKDGWLTQEQIEHKRQTVSAERWRVEYLLGEPSIGTRAIVSDAVEKMFSMPAPTADDTVKFSKNYEEYFFESHKITDDYVIAADWARVKDYTVITVWKTTSMPMKLVYFVRMKHTDWPIQIKKFNQLKRQFRAEGIHDATGLGDVVASMLDDSNDVWDFKMTGAQRSDMLSEFILGVERGFIKSPKIESFYKEILFASDEDVFSKAEKYHLPDSFCSAALAWRLVSDRYPGSSPVGLPKTDPWLEKAMQHNISPQDHRRQVDKHNPSGHELNLLGMQSYSDPVPDTLDRDSPWLNMIGASW